MIIKFHLLQVTEKNFKIQKNNNFAIITNNEELY